MKELPVACPDCTDYLVHDASDANCKRGDVDQSRETQSYYGEGGDRDRYNNYKREEEYQVRNTGVQCLSRMMSYETIIRPL